MHMLSQKYALKGAVKRCSGRVDSGRKMPNVTDMCHISSSFVRRLFQAFLLFALVCRPTMLRLHTEHAIVSKMEGYLPWL